MHLYTSFIYICHFSLLQRAHLQTSSTNRNNIHTILQRKILLWHYKTCEIYKSSQQIYIIIIHFVIIQFFNSIFLFYYISPQTSHTFLSTFAFIIFNLSRHKEVIHFNHTIIEYTKEFQILPSCAISGSSFL